MSFAEAFQNLKKAFENFGHVLTFSLIPAMRKEYIQITNYNCPICGNILGIYSHNNYEIIYKCVHCGRLHKAKKNNVLGRFLK